MKAIFTFVCLILLSSAILADDKPANAVFLDHVEKISRDGGVWLADNPDYTEGSGQAVQYGYETGSPLGNAVMSLTIFGIDETGARTDYWYSVSWWDATRETIRLRNWGANGVATVSGTITMTEAGDLTQLEGIDWGGNPLRFNDATEWSGDDAFISITSVLKDGEWEESQRLRWKRAASGS